ncbi:MAG: hypothetical protein ABSF29_05130 [Tepidisphaeraceae bacterium]
MKPPRLAWSLLLIFAATVAGLPVACPAWSHQGHILITRLAALRIIQDPSAPQGLRDFLRQNMAYSMDDCKALATVQTVGAHPEDIQQFDIALDRWATMPDRMKAGLAGMRKIEPYGMTESYMHRLDLEVFSATGYYKDDLSGKPDVEKIPHDLSDPRWKRGGFVPWRVEEMYHRLATAFGPGDSVADSDAALMAAGYLAHYIEDSTQPHHTTGDYQSQSYLAGHVPGVFATRPAYSALVAMRLPSGVNPHGDIEYELFENSDEPRKDLREEFWGDLIARIDSMAATRAAQTRPTCANFDPFRWDLRILSDSYDYLPFVGRAAQAGYVTGKFDPAAFFGYTGQTHGQTMNMIQLIALQNAKAVLDVEMAYRLAWDEAHQSVAVK